MAKKRSGRDRRPQQRRPREPREHRPHPGDGLGPQSQDLFVNIRTAMRSDDPMDLLVLTSGLLEVTQPRPADPFQEPEAQAPIALPDLVESFIDTPYAETTAVLTSIRALVRDEALATRIGEALTQRRHPLPDWLSRLDRATAEPDVWFLTHVLGDGDDFLVGVELAPGMALSALIYVDHNLGTVVKDAFVVPGTVEDLALELGRRLTDPEQSLTRVDAAAARATVEAAIARGSRYHPPLTTDSWPSCRPLVEWMLGLLPPGGTAPERHEWTEQETTALAERFFASSHGAPLDRPDQRELIEPLLGFATQYASGDPYRWSSVSVEMLLADWAPRAIAAPVPMLLRLPDLLRAYILFAHDHVGIRADLTTATLAAVDAYEPVFRDAVGDGPTGLDQLDMDELGEIFFRSLDDAVGSHAVLMDLDLTPLPDEAFDWSEVPDDVRPAVQEVLDLCDACADELFDVEHRTAMRRFLARAAAVDPAIFRRRASRPRAAAAVAWVICRANEAGGTFGAYGGKSLNVQDLLAWFGVTGSVSQRAEAFLRANGADAHGQAGAMDLGTPDLLTAARRRRIAQARDQWTALLAEGPGGMPWS